MNQDEQQLSGVLRQTVYRSVFLFPHRIMSDSPL